MISKSAIGIAVGICGSLFIGYCVYFDRKRRSDPDFKRKLRERREAREAATKLPDLNDHEAVKSFFVRESMLAEELLAQGDFKGGVEHLGNSVAVFSPPTAFLKGLKKTLPPQIFQSLLQRLSVLGVRIAGQNSATVSAGLER